jgi:hypothetical protein
MDRTEHALDRSGIPIAPPMRVRAVTKTIASAPALAPSTRVREQEPTGSETESSDSESSLYADYRQESTMNKSVGGREDGEILVDAQQMQVDDVQLGDSEIRRGDEIGGEVGSVAMGESVGDGDEGDYGDGDRGMGYDENMDDDAAQHVPELSRGDVASWPGDGGYAQHMHGLHAKDQDDNVEALWKSFRGGARYRAAADEELPSLHLQVPKHLGFHRSKEHHAIPLNLDSIMNHFGTPRKHKRGRSQADSVESRQSKVNRQSASHSTAAIQSTMVSTGAQSPSSAIPSTKVSTRPQSPSHSASPVGHDFQGASRATEGVFRGRALGNALNWADTKAMNSHDASSKPNGKVLLYTSRDQDAPPAMMIMHETVAQLPPILEKLSRKFSPIRSK